MSLISVFWLKSYVDVVKIVLNSVCWELFINVFIFLFFRRKDKKERESVKSNTSIVILLCYIWCT
jgi:glucose uptake protein GlcU